MWFYHHKVINFIYPFVLEHLNLGEMLTKNMIINYKVYQNHQTEKSDTTFSWVSVTQTFKII